MAANLFAGLFSTPAPTTQPTGSGTPVPTPTSPTPKNLFSGLFGAQTPTIPTPASPIKPTAPMPVANSTPSTATPLPDPLESALSVMPEVQSAPLRAQAQGMPPTPAVTPPPQTNMAQPIQNALRATGSYFKNLFTNPEQTVRNTTGAIANELGEQAIVHPIATAKAIGTQVYSSSGQVIQNLASAASQFGSDVLTPSTGRDISTKISSTLGLLTAIAQFTMYPISETYSIASQLPVIKPVADAIGIGFNAAGKVGSFTASTLLNQLPLSQASKSELQTTINSVGTLAGQILLGGYIYESITDKMVQDPNAALLQNSGLKSGKVLMEQYGLTDEDVKPIIQDVQTKAQQINDDSESEKPSENPVKPSENEGESEIVQPKNNRASIQNSQEIDLRNPQNPINDIIQPVKPRTPMDAVIDKFTPENKPTTDIILPKTPVAVKGDGGEFKVTSDAGGKNVKVVNLATGEEETVPRTNVVPQEAPPTLEDEIAQPKRRTGALKPVEGTGETKIRGLSEGVEQKAIENKLTDQFGDLPEYKTVNMADQASKAVKLMVDDPETARAIALGNKAAPKGLIPEAVFTAVENQAIADGDAETLKALAKSGLTSEATTMGQRIRTLAERDPDSPTDAIREIQEAREKAAQGKAEAEAKKASDAIKQATSDRISGKTKMDWSSFVKSLEC